MSKHYGAIAFTKAVRDVQRDHGGHAFYDRKRLQDTAVPGADALTGDETDYVAERDSFYLATVSETGWPYVQFHGGPPGFLRVVDDHTIGWADFRGNLQYIRSGNVAGDNRVALIAMDYANQRRLKIYGHASIVTVEQDPALVAKFADPAYDAVVERAVVVAVEAFDWNRPQHVTARFTVEELETQLAPLRHQLAESRAENTQLRAKLDRGE